MTDSPKQPATSAGPRLAYRIPGLPRRPAGFAPNPYIGPHWREPEPEPEPEPESAPAPAPSADPAADLAAELGRSLQLSRAGALALTRLSLAIKSGDRQAAMAAMDRLHALDAEMERLVDRLPAPAEADPAHAEWQAITRHLADQKLSLAFEKLAMASEISGPAMVSAQSRRSPPPAPRPQPAGAPADPADSRVTPIRPRPSAAPRAEAPRGEWPPLPAMEPSEWRALPVWIFGLLAVLLALAALAVAAVTLTGA